MKKFPRLLPPWPFGLLVRDPIRPFPTNTILIVSPILLIPFAPFGVFELRCVERTISVASHMGF